MGHLRRQPVHALTAASQLLLGYSSQKTRVERLCSSSAQINRDRGLLNRPSRPKITQPQLLHLLQAHRRTRMNAFSSCWGGSGTRGDPDLGFVTQRAVPALPIATVSSTSGTLRTSVRGPTSVVQPQIASCMLRGVGRKG